jgi:hypothetical protein
MNPLTSIILSSLIGLMAGIQHGVVSHRADLPFSLPEQALQSLTPQTSTQY